MREHFPSIELIERRPDELGDMAMIPTAIRVDGVDWAVSAERPVTVESIDLANPDDPVRVTFTVFARRVLIDTEVS